MKRLKKLTGIASAIVLTFMFSACPPPASNSPTVETISKVTLFENTANPSMLLNKVSYERTSTAHVFYVKTTMVASNYIDALRAIDPRIGDAFTSDSKSGDLWAPLFIGIDKASASAPTANYADMGNLVVKTADSTFEFDALIRVNSDYNKPNIVDGLPLRAENGNVYLNTLQAGKDPKDGDYWSVADEIKFQGASDEADNKMIGGTGTVLSNNYTTNKVATTYFSYDSSTGEYIFKIPFSVISATDIKKICVYGIQNSGWRPGSTINAVVKPLGSSKVIVEASGGTVYGLTAVTIPTSPGQAPVVTSLVTYDVISGTKDIDAHTNAQTITGTGISVVSETTNAMIPLFVYAGSVTNIMYMTNSGTNAQGSTVYIGSNDLTVGLSGQDFNSVTNFTLNFNTSNTAAPVSVNVTIEPTISLDKTSYVVDPSTSTVTVTVEDGYNPGASVIATNTNTGSNYTVNLTSGSGTFTVGDTNQTANLTVNAGEGFLVIYSDSDSGKTYSASATGVSAPDFTIDGFKEAMYSTAPSVADPTGDTGSWGIEFTKLYITNDATDLFIALDLKTVDGQWKQMEVFIDADNNTATGITSLTDNAWGLMDHPQSVIFTSIGADFGFRAWSADYTNFVAMTNGIDVKSDVSYQGTWPTFLELSVPLATLGVTSGSTIKLIALHANDWDGGSQLLDAIPDTSPNTFVDNGAGPATNTNAVPYTIK